MFLHYIALLLVFGESSSEDAPVVCPHSCYCDDRGEYVSCVGDGQLGFPEKLPESIIRLELRNYGIPELRHEHLLLLSSMEELHLQQSGLEEVAEGAFVSSSRLQKLDLSRNRLSYLNGSSLSYLGSLRQLDLSSNRIESSEEAFEPLANLEQLNMRDNLIPQLTTRTFAGLHKIQYLNLDSNNISAIEVGTFQYLTNLARLILSSNPLTTLSRLDFFGSRLQYIDVSLAGLGRVPQTLTRFVRDLRLAGNELSVIGAGDLDSYPYLGLLVLDDNCIKEIENDALGRLEYLVRLWLNGNCLTKIPPNLPPSLLALYLEENKLSSLPSYGFRGLLHLEQLFLQRNEIVELQPCAFCDLVNLKSLDLQANRIADLSSGVFDNLTQLETLDLSQNNLKWMDVLCFNRLTSLTTLQMSRVHTSVEIDETLFDPLHNLHILEVYDSPNLVQTMLNSTRLLHGLRNVQELNLMHNYLTRLRADFPSFFPSLKIVKLSGNLWKCDGDIKWLSNWIKQSNVQFYSSYNIRCAGPSPVQFKPLMMLTDSDITFTDKQLMDFSTVRPTNELFTMLSVTVFTTVLSPTQTEGSSSSQKAMTLPFTFTPSATELPNAKKYTSTKDTGTTVLPSATSGSKTSSTGTSSQESVVTRTILLKSVSSTTAKNEPTIGENDLFTSSSSSTTWLQNKRVNSKRISQYQEDESESHYIYHHKIAVPTTTPSMFASTNDKHAFNIPTATAIPTSETSLASTTPPLKLSSSGQSPRTPGLFNATAFARTSNKSFPTPADAYTRMGTRAYYLGLVVLASVVLFALVVGFAALGAVRVLRRPPYHPVKRSSSISYYPQTDEVSIVTLTEGGAVGLGSGGTHRGLGNKLYYIMEDGKLVDGEAGSHGGDPQLQELLPTGPPDSNRLY